MLSFTEAAQHQSGKTLEINGWMKQRTLLKTETQKPSAEHDITAVLMENVLWKST